MSASGLGGLKRGGQTGWQMFCWPLLMALVNAVGLVAALVGDGWYDLVSWGTLGVTLVVIVAAWRGWLARSHAGSSPAMVAPDATTTHSQGAGRAIKTRDGRSLFLMERGTRQDGEPIIVFEAGMAAPCSSWGLVQPALPETVHAVVYDCAGLGRSEPDPEPRTVARMADDLDDLLDALGDGPFILVATSGGALIVRERAKRHPERIAGMVLVDPTDEGCEPVFSPGFRRLEKGAHHASVLLARFGLLERLYNSFLLRLPPDSQSDFRKEGFTTGAMRTRGAELKGMVAAMNGLRGQIEAPSDMPVTVISGALADRGMAPTLRATANAAHARRAALSTSGRHVIAERSGHMVPFIEPELIVAEIMRLHGGAISGGPEARA